MQPRFLSRAARPPTDDAAADEAMLIVRAQADPQAFAPLYRQYLDPIHQYCYRRLGSREAAEDATSRIFERALTALPSYRGGVFRAWLFTIAQHVITDSYRARRAHQPLDAADATADPGPDPETLAVLADEQRLLRAALAVLPTDQRQVLELRLSGLPATEIAAILHRTPESVRTLQLRAVRRLQGLLGIPTTATEARHA